MNPLRLRLSTYRDYADLDLVLPDGCVAIVGENGHGKSSLLDAIELALFVGRGELAQWLTVGASSTELMIEMEFEHAGHSYRVRRGFSARGAGKTVLDLEEGDGGFSEHDGRWLPSSDWRPLTLGSVKETQALLEQILGFGRLTFGAGAFCKQHEGGAFCEAEPSRRKEILSDTLGLERYKLLLAAVRRDVRAAEQEIARIDGRLEGVTREELQHERTALADVVDQHTATFTRANMALAEWEAKLEEAAQAVQAAKENETARTAMKTRVDAAAAALAAKGQLQRDAIAAGEQAAGVRAELGELFGLIPVTAEAEQQERDLVAQIEQHRVAVGERNQLVSLRELRAAEAAAIDAQVASVKAKRDELDRKIAHLESGELDICPTCEQQLGAEARAATVGSLRAQAQAAQDEVAALVERAAMIVLPEIPDESVLPVEVPARLTAIRATLTAAREAELERAKLTERLTGFETTIARASETTYLDELRAAADGLQALLEESAKLPDPVDVTPLETAAVTARTRVQVERDRLQTAERDRAVAQERLNQLTTRAAQLEKDIAAREQHRTELDLLAILERAYGPDGIPALVTENAAIPQLEAEANRVLTALGGETAGCRIELRTGRAKADGGIRDVLDVVVVTEAGDRVYETFSGGEKTRLNLALRLALARLLATRRGAESKLFAIDEPEALDDDGKAALLDVLRGLEQDGVFHKIYLVSHDPTLRDSFDVVLQVVKDPDGRSRVEGALAEAVAA